MVDHKIQRKDKMWTILCNISILSYSILTLVYFKSSQVDTVRSNSIQYDFIHFNSVPHSPYLLISTSVWSEERGGTLVLCGN